MTRDQNFDRKVNSSLSLDAVCGYGYSCSNGEVQFGGGK